MTILVVFQSKTGFTKKYAQWIAEDLSCDCKNLSNVQPSEISCYDLVVYGGWIMGGMINGLDKVREYTPKQLIVFGVGFTSKKDADINQMVESNKLTDLPFYYYEGGTDPKKMGFMGRMMVKMVTKKTPTYADHTNKNAIQELVKSVKDIKK